jgi:phage repressor protein C with HTH and peptisase S24 domain
LLARFGFDARWLRRLSATPDLVSMISVTGDSMMPTLNAGDDILVDRGDAADRLRDGIYVLRLEEALLVKRLARHPASGRISIRSDNPAYPSWEVAEVQDLVIIGRVIWAGRRIA